MMKIDFLNHNSYVIFSLQDKKKVVLFKEKDFDML